MLRQDNDTYLRWPTWVFVALALLYLAIGLSPYHYWDEYFYLYSVFINEPATLFALEPKLGGFFPSGFFTAKPGMVAWLDMLVDSIGPGYQALKQLNLIFYAQTIAFVLGAHLVFKALLPGSLLGFAVLCLAFSPLNMYLGGKLLSEVPSLLCLVFAMLSFLKSIHTKSDTKGFWMLVSGFLVAAACWLRLTSALGMLGLVLGLLVYQHRDYPFIKTLFSAVVVGVLSLCLLWAVLLLSGLDPIQSLSGLSDNLAHRSHSWILKVYALGTFGQLFFVLFLLGLCQTWSRLHLMAIVWLLVTSAPFILGSSYSEPRFYYLALLPFSIICGLGLQNINQLVRLKRSRALVITAFVAMVIMNRFAFLPLMPYEHDQDRYYRFIKQTQENKTSMNYFPWVTDFAFARFVLPKAEQRLTMNWTYNDQADFFETKELQQWAGKEFVIPRKPDTSLPTNQSVNYIGWEFSPVIDKLQTVTKGLGLPIHLTEGQKNHLSLGWPWEQLKDNEVTVSDGHYQLYTYRPTAK